MRGGWGTEGSGEVCATESIEGAGAPTCMDRPAARRRGRERTADQARQPVATRIPSEETRLTSGVASAKATLEAAAWHAGHTGQARRLGSFEQTSAGWTALRDAIAPLQASAHPEPTAAAGTEREAVAVVLEPTGGDELAFALWARQQPGWQV